MTADVTTCHADYLFNAPQWTLCEDAAAGEATVKAAGDAYLPRPNPQDKSQANQHRFDSYIKRAVYYNATGRTLQGLVGLAFGQKPELKLPAGMKMAEEDLSGTGLPFVQHAQATLGELLKTGRGGLLVDYPPVDGTTVSVAHQKSGAVRPTVTLYRAVDITNWRASTVGGRTTLSMVVLQEQYATDAGFETSTQTQYRVLRFDGTYQVEIWRKVKDQTTGQEDWAIVQEYSPLNGSGAQWTEMPFTFIGSQNNDWCVDPAPLYDIATLNIAHYRNSADYEDSVFLVGQPQYWIAGVDAGWLEELEKNGHQMYIGARSPIILPTGGTMGIEQAQPNSLAKEAMASKETQMAALGARLIQETTQVKTARQVTSEDTVAHSVLALSCQNVNAAYGKVIVWYATFANVTSSGGKLVLPTDFSNYQIDAQSLVAMLQAVQAGTMPLVDFWTQLQQAGLIDPTKTPEEIQEEIESQPPLGGTPPAADPAAQDDPSVDPSAEPDAAAA